MQSVSEEELVLQLKSKNAQAFRHLYDAYAPALFGSIQRLIPCTTTAEDVLQTVFIKIWTFADKYDASKGRLFTWMFNIARNTTIDHMRTQQVRPPQISIIYTDETIKDPHSPERLEARLDIRKMIGDLPLKERTILDLIMAGYTCKEVGSLLDMPEGTVKTRMRTSYRKLQSALQ